MVADEKEGQELSLSFLKPCGQKSFGIFDHWCSSFSTNQASFATKCVVRSKMNSKTNLIEIFLLRKIIHFSWLKNSQPSKKRDVVKNHVN